MILDASATVVVILAEPGYEGVLHEADAEVAPFGQDHYEVALDAFSGTG